MIKVGRADRPAEVHGVHGAAGVTNWTCFSRRAGLDGDWEAIEWASVPVGGVSGEHRHTRTEEIYFILSGRAEVRLDGEPHVLGPGGMVLTCVGSTHALHNVGDSRVDWLVIEMLSPDTATSVRGRAVTEKRTSMGSTVVDLAQLGQFDPRQVFAGPLENIALRSLSDGETLELSAHGVEHTLFVTEGSGLGKAQSTEISLSAGTSVTLPLGSELTVIAGQPGLKVFLATMAVRP
ncbi:cupin domain-containing protein [Kutzneria sp. NPDC052558]|uniref:cupin domain-containing protein n=1 Tax=Kutzneria sp. NPDC052558 TaxID=3364121 RepID=UPI0037C72893